MSRQTPRRPASSRTPVSRPRRLAGQGGAPGVEEAPVVEEVAQQPSRDLATIESSADTGTPDLESGDERAPRPPEGQDRPGLAALFDSRRATTVLVALVVALAVAAGGLFAWDSSKGQDRTEPSKQPVVLSSDDVNAGVEAAAKAAETIVATSYKNYDQQVDEATALMTPAFAKEYRQTAEDIKDQFVQAKTELEARVVAQGVVHATRTEVQALVFLNEYVSKDQGDTTYTPYRALVTVVHTDSGWLVSSIDTK